ncbi:DUF2586 family protein [Paenibacillus melissococcoides]|uniref:DUF2586 family protein n=1 Tax=Paenibacillus melissococcoides TaxID=2912268 RepID=UPI0036F19CD0
MRQPFGMKVDGLFGRRSLFPLSGVLDITGYWPEICIFGSRARQGEILPGRRHLYRIDDRAQMSNQDVLAAMDKLRNVSFSFEFVHIVGESAKTLWTAVSEQNCEAARYVQEAALAICEAPQWRWMNLLTHSSSDLLKLAQAFPTMTCKSYPPGQNIGRWTAGQRWSTMAGIGLRAVCSGEATAVYRRDEELQHSRNEDVGAAARRY